MIANKGGQTTIFIIIAILIVVGIGLFFLLKNNSNSEFNVNSKNIISSIKSCINQEALDQVYFVGLQGGYYSPPQNSLEVSFLEVPIYLNKGELVAFPTKEILEEELSKAVLKNIDSCFKLNEFKNQGYEIKESVNRSIKTKINKDYVEVELFNILTITKNENTVQYKNINEKVNFDYLSKYEAVKKFIELQQTDKDYIFLTQLEELGKQAGFRAEINGIANTGDYFYNFKFDKIINKNQTYTYSFVVRY